MNYTAKQMEALNEVAARLKLEELHKADALLAEFRRLCRKGIFRRNEFALVASFASPMWAGGIDVPSKKLLKFAVKNLKFWVCSSFTSIKRGVSSQNMIVKRSKEVPFP